MEHRGPGAGRCRLQRRSVDSVWRNRDHFLRGRDEIVTFLRQKWERELDGNGLMRRREASINDVPTRPDERRMLGPRPEGDEEVPALR